MFTLKRSVVIAMFGLSLMFASSASAVLIGNNVSVGRLNASDGATDVFQVYDNAPVPGTGVINAFAIFDQGGNNGLTGQAFVLRPTGGNNYLVLSADALVGTGTNLTKLFPVTPIAVQLGDLIASYGRSIPYTDGPLGGSFQPIYYPSPSAPVVGNTITLNSGAFPENNNFIRDYAFAANFVAAAAIPEPATAGLLGLAGVALLRRRRTA